MANKHQEISYIEFLRYCLNESCVLSESVRSIDWQKLLQWAQQQAIVGVVFNGIERAGNTISIPREDLLQWIGNIQQIEQQNRILNKRSVELCESFHSNGLECCILKGQGNAMMYPYPLRRTSGDIDVWMQGKSIKETIQFAHNNNPKGKACYHHVDYGMFKDVEVEVHYRPSFMFNPLHNYRLQKWFRSHTESTEITELPESVGIVNVPNKEFNIVFQLSHVYNHLLHEGIGLRQIVDYYYLLKSNTDKTVPVSKFQVSGLAESAETLKYLGLGKIAGAMMWVLAEVLGLEEKYLIVPVDERRGRFLFDEIMKGGNFGHFDQRVNHQGGQFTRNIQRLKRDIRMVQYFPSECLWEPVFRIYHWIWRLRYN